MKFFIQRVNHANVSIEGAIIGQIQKGFLIFIGVCDSDDEAIADKMIKKTAALRIMADHAGKTNLSIQDVGGQILAVSQFTLYADCKKGNRPSFFKSGSPEHANALYEYIIKEFREQYGFTVATGEFGADMKVTLENDGPFSVMLDSDELFS